MSSTATRVPATHIAAVRSFNRFFTRHIGVLREGLLHSPYSLTEVRVMYELAQGEQLASRLGRNLGLDRGYLSRILARFEKEGLVARLRSESDGRAKLLQLTEAGRAVFDPLDRRSRDEVAELLARLGDAGQQSMLAAMRTIQELLDERPGMKYAQPFFLRPHRPGDMGWIAYRHGFIYAEENGWDNSFEALVAQICADFIQRFDPQQEQCWIAEMNGERAGSIALARADEEGVAKLRLLLVEPKARGYGLGARLVDECLAFARAKGYRKIQLWTTSSQTEARQLYRKVGFALTAHEAAHSFGHDLVNETWELLL